MNNNDIIRRIRYTFDLNDDTMIALFTSAGLEVTRADISDWLKKDDDPLQKKLNDNKLAYFLNGFIIKKRGKQEGPLPVAEKQLNNNIIFRKLKIALALKDDQLIEILQSVDFRFGKHELSALFRKPDHDKFRPCKDQVLRNFIYGLQEKFRPNGERD